MGGAKTLKAVPCWVQRRVALRWLEYDSPVRDWAKRPQGVSAQNRSDVGLTY
jgi:hypothetical protein